MKAVIEGTAKVEYSTPYQTPGSIWVWNLLVLYAQYDLTSPQQVPIDTCTCNICNNPLPTFQVNQ